MPDDGDFTMDSALRSRRGGKPAGSQARGRVIRGSGGRWRWWWRHLDVTDRKVAEERRGLILATGPPEPRRIW